MTRRLTKICTVFLLIYSYQVSCAFAENSEEGITVLDISLQQAIELAKENSPLMKIGELEVDTALQRTRE